jgi:hypothetical protein
MMLTQNKKMKKATLKTWNFDIPAGKTCIGADKCLDYCYATKGFYKMPIVARKHENNLLASKNNSFTHLINFEINELKRKNKIEALRIHSAGDFYSREYLLKWIDIANNNPDIVFYCYTKSIPLFIKLKLPENFRVIYSRGGKYDHVIDQYRLRSCELVEAYDDGDTTSDDNDSMIIFSQDNIKLIKRKVR